MKKNMIAAILFAALLSISQFGIAQEAPLFQSEEPLELILEADLITIINDKSKEPEYTEALLIQKLPDNKISAFEIKVKPRGNTRRLTALCDFPPLKFNFKKNHVTNTVFEGQDKLKFVSQCRQNDEFKSYVLEEYLIYKSYNLFTEASYRTRLVHITVKDIKLRIPALTMTGFLIEDDKNLGKRIGAKEYKEMVYHQDSCQDVAIDRLSMFQYMVGNTDWYVNTKHNMDVFQLKSNEDLVPVPFDFDFAGVINTTYAIPSSEIPITDVRQRYFKGSCREIEDYGPTIQLFNDQKERLFELYMSFEHLPKITIKKSLRYFSKFYKIINSPEQADASFQRACESEFTRIRARR